jgi:hypothetical protein
MDQFGLKMDFLWLNQVPALIYILKNSFLFVFFDIFQVSGLVLNFREQQGAEINILQDTARHK